MYSHPFRGLCITGLMALLALNTPAAMAKTYKWVDENGVTQYTATPPPKGDFTAIKKPPKPAVDPVKAKSEFEKRQEAFQKRRDETSKAKEESDKLAAKAAENSKKCQQARKNMTNFTTNSRIRITDKDGTVRNMPEEERQASIKRAQEAIDSYCQ